MPLKEPKMRLMDCQKQNPKIFFKSVGLKKGKRLGEKLGFRLMLH